MPFVELVGGPFDGSIVFLGELLEGDFIAGGVLRDNVLRHEADWSYESTGEVNASGNTLFTYRPKRDELNP